MKSEKISIKWKIFIYMLSFVAVLLLVLWLFQTVYLNDFYKYIKKKEILNAEDKVVSVLNNDDADDDISTIASNYDICILVTDMDGSEIYSAETKADCSIHKMRQDMLLKLIEKAENSENETQITMDNKDVKDIIDNKVKPYNFIPDNQEQLTLGETFDLDKTPEDIPNDNLQSDKQQHYGKMLEDKSFESIVRVKIVTVNNVQYAVFLNSIITPVSATVHTLRIQLIYISIILVLLSLMIALLISRRVSKSIILINKSAKEMAKGNFDIEFNGRDYKEITELCETLNHTAKELSKSDVLQKELLANVSHDLRTPLTMITGYSEVMRDLPGENTPENVQVIIDEANRLTLLVNDLLDMSKIQAGVTSLETKEYDLTESIRAVIERHSKLLEPYGYIIEFNCETDVLVEADEFKIYQVIYNLIGNAVNYTGEDKRIIVNQKINQDIVRIEVQDTGEGIPKDKLENVWDRYYKIDKTHKRAVVGSGLGLSIVQNILKMHKANYGVESIMGKGSTFWFELGVTGKTQL